MTGLKTFLGDEVLADNHYRFDGNGNRIEKRQKQGTITYTYDEVNRLSTVEYPGRKEELFYDKAGNRTRRVTNGMEELYRYDGRNRLQEYTRGGNTTKFEYDRAGNLLRDDKASYEYDAFNRTHKVETFDGNIQINRYDTEGLRHEMEENGKLVQFIFRGTEVVAEESQESRIRYIRTGELLASDAECARTYYHYASDEMGSITHVTAGVAKEEGGEEEEPPGVKILNQYEYDAWGNVTACEETVENRFRFNGQQYDPVAQQYYLRARFYNPVIGRFTQEDTYRGDGLNLYTYCRNNPVYYVDPSGHICQNAAERISKLIDEGRIKGENRDKLKKYLQMQIDAGTIMSWERDIADKLGVSGSKNLEGGSQTNPNALRYNGDGTWTSNEGLIYGQGSKDGNRVKHVLQHTQPDPSKPVHTVFNVDRSNVIGLVDEAWTNRGSGVLQSNGNVCYDINMGRTVGTNNETIIRIITRGYSNNIITAYPK